MTGFDHKLGTPPMEMVAGLLALGSVAAGLVALVALRRLLRRG